jgi:hypothetical protein
MKKKSCEKSPVSAGLFCCKEKAKTAPLYFKQCGHEVFVRHRLRDTLLNAFAVCHVFNHLDLVDHYESWMNVIPPVVQYSPFW